jgi:hypothetical protein
MGPVTAPVTSSNGLGEALGEVSLLVVGGRQREPRSIRDRDQRWYGYGSGVVLRLDPDGVETPLCYESKPGTFGPDDPILFKCGTVRDDRVYLCTQTEVLVLALPDLALEHHISLPCFNDVHHVVPLERGTLLVANSGLEMVLEITLDGEIVQMWNVLGEDPWQSFSADVDYRVGVDLKPHRAHPNHIFFIGDEAWTTRFELRDAISLEDPSRRIDIGQERVHDGVVDGDQVLFTTVDGHVVVANTETLEVTERIRLEVPDDAIGGWCRGLAIDGDDVWVGFTRIRPTRFREAVSWVRSGLQRSCPTRVARYRRADWRLQAEIDVEPYGVNAVFTIAPQPRLARAQEQAG